MNPNIKYIGAGFLIGGGIAVILIAAAWLAGMFPARHLSVLPTEQLEVMPLAFDVSASAPILAPTLMPASTPSAELESALADQIHQAVSTYGGEWNILIREDGIRDVFSYHAEDRDHVASIIKPAIAMLFFKSLEEKGIAESEYADFLSSRGIGRTYSQLLKAMLVDSEEAAAHLLWGYIQESGLDFGSTLKSWGAFHTDIGSRHSTPADIAALYESLYFGNAVTPEARNMILNSMSAYTPNDDTRLGVLRPLLPPGAEYYNKRGSVTEGRLIIGDSAILAWNQNGRGKMYALVILAYNGAAPTSDIKLERGIESIAHSFWDFVAAQNQ